MAGALFVWFFVCFFNLLTLDAIHKSSYSVNRRERQHKDGKGLNISALQEMFTQHASLGRAVVLPWAQPCSPNSTPNHMKESLSLGDHRDLCDAELGQGVQHFLARISSWVCLWNSPSHLPSLICGVEAAKAKGRKGLFWHEALATLGPKKALFSHFSPHSGLCLALRSYV